MRRRRVACVTVIGNCIVEGTFASTRLLATVAQTREDLLKGVGNDVTSKFDDVVIVFAGTLGRG